MYVCMYMAACDGLVEILTITSNLKTMVGKMLHVCVHKMY